MLELRAIGTLGLDKPGMRAERALLRQPKRMALLLYLALARPRGLHRRDKLVALFWPESDPQRARHALRQAVYVLRGALGARAIVRRGDEELGLRPGALRCDAVEFEEAVRHGEHARALDLYRGELLDGFHVAEVAPEFRQWLEDERWRLHRLAARAAWAEAGALRDRGDSEGAREMARRAAAFTPVDEDAQRRLILLLQELGDRAGAAAAYRAYERRLVMEYELEPSPELRELVRGRRGSPAAGPVRGVRSSGY